MASSSPSSSDPVRTEQNAAWVARMRAGDPSAMREIYVAYADGLARVAARYLGSPDAAEDLVQDVLLHVWEMRGRLREDGSLRAMLYAAVRNRALNVMARRGIEQRWRDDFVAVGRAPAMGTAMRPADEMLERDEMARAVAEALAQLPERAREVAQLRWYEQLSRAEIAEVLAITPQTVSNHLTHATRALRRLLAGLGPAGGEETAGD